MSSISSSTSTQSALAKAQAKLLADEAAKAAQNVIQADQKAVKEATLSPSASTSSVDVTV